MLNFIQISKDDIDRIWDDCVPMLEKSFDRLINDYDCNDIKLQCQEENMQLWVAIKDNMKIIGCVVTLLVQHPKNKILNVVNLGGEHIEEWAHIMDITLNGFALENDCKAVRAWTRRGFAKLIPNFEEDGVILVKLIGGTN